MRITMKSIIVLFALLFALFTHQTAAFQDKEGKEAQTKKEIYIPKDLGDAHSELLRILPKDTIEQIKQGTEREMIRYHRGLGMWLRNNWGLWKGSPLGDYFHNLGIYHPDDMSGIILDTFWCKLHNQPFRLKQRIEYYQEYWRSMEEPKGGSPKDGAKIVWVITKGSGKGVVHLGISISDKSFWRYVYGGDKGIEPATQKDKMELEELIRTWDRLGTRLEDIKQ